MLDFFDEIWCFNKNMKYIPHFVGTFDICPTYSSGFYIRIEKKKKYVKNMKNIQREYPLVFLEKHEICT